MQYIKDFMHMSDEEFEKYPVRYGRIKITPSSYYIILRQEFIATREQLAKSQKAFDRVAGDLDDQYLLLLMLMFGDTPCTLGEFCDKYKNFDARDYLVNTPVGMLNADFHRACEIIRELSFISPIGSHSVERCSATLLR